MGPTLDELTVALLRASSPRHVLARNDADERRGLDPYANPRPERRDPRSRLLFCAAPDCGRPFVSVPRGDHARYCGFACSQRDYYRARRTARSRRAHTRTQRRVA